MLEIVWKQTDRVSISFMLALMNARYCVSGPLKWLAKQTYIWILSIQICTIVQIVNQVTVNRILLTIDLHDLNLVDYDRQFNDVISFNHDRHITVDSELAHIVTKVLKGLENKKLKYTKFTILTKSFQSFFF